MRDQHDIDALLAQVAREFYVSVPELRSASRRSDLVEARWVAMAVLRKWGYPVDEIGRLLARCHSTVVYGLVALRARPCIPSLRCRLRLRDPSLLALVDEFAERRPAC
jgi:chromosomal replication initiation ATPase DnaA